MLLTAGTPSVNIFVKGELTKSFLKNSDSFLKKTGDIMINSETE